MKKLLSCVSCLLASVAFASMLAGCGFEDDYSYESIDPGTLTAPTETFKRKEDDAAQNAKYRAAYPTLEKYSEPVKINVGVIQYELEPNVKVGTTPLNQSFNRLAKEVLNIDLNYTVIASATAYDQKINLAIAANQMPDMFYTTLPSVFTTLRDTGLLADLTDAYYHLNDNLLYNYEEYMPDIVKACMKEGNLYALPQQTNKFASAQRLYIRKDWLEIAGVEAPTTIDEMIEVGQAFLDHKDEIAAATGVSASKLTPFTMHKDITYAGSYSAEGLFNAHGASIGSFFKGEDGKLYSSNTSPEARAAVETMRTMYERGILDKEFLSSAAANVQSFVSAGYVGMVFGEWWLPKDALGTCVESKSVKGADWVWVDLPDFGGKDSLPIVDTMLISGYNLVSSQCKHPEAVAKLLNLFYDVYYDDNAQDTYGPDVLPSNGFYYQFVPVKLWDGMASDMEYKRVNRVFNELYEGGLTDRDMFKDGLFETLTKAEYDAAVAEGKVYLISSSGSSYDVLNRDVVKTIEANETLSAAFNSLRSREKILHFAEGYPYFVAYKAGVATKDMTEKEKKGWGIYHEMIDENGSYAYVVDLADGKREAKFDEFYGTALTAMDTYGEYVTSQTGIEFTKMISGESPMSAFEAFVKDYNKNGGTTIVNQVNAWYEAVHQYD